jgi:transcription initiation factor TFIIIB Brf1 subunit/transcription initiation factor TFIIB
MYSQQTEYSCPSCAGIDMRLDPTNDRVACSDCKAIYSKESIVEWQNTGVRPDPLSRDDGPK